MRPPRFFVGWRHGEPKLLDGLNLTTRSDRDLFNKTAGIISEGFWDERHSPTWCAYMLNNDLSLETFKQLYNCGLAVYNIQKPDRIDESIDSSRSRCLQTMYEHKIYTERQWMQWLVGNKEVMFSSDPTFMDMYNHGFRVFRYAMFGDGEAS
jgi:hypothetical protein